MEQKDYYEILGIEKTANQKQLKDAYRTLALRYHPDRNKGIPGAPKSERGCRGPLVLYQGNRTQMNADKHRFF